MLEQDLAQLELALAAGPAAGPWELWTSCSWMRVKNAQGEEVLGPCKDVDGQLNLKARRGTLDYVVACNPERMSRVVSALKVLLEERACMKQQLVTLNASSGTGEASEAEVVIV